jgi:biopolymer transport protein ExbD
LLDQLKKAVEDGEKKKKSVGSQIRNAVSQAKKGAQPEEEVDDFRKITIQSDKDIEFLTVKKVMYTVTEAGMREINFAVMKRADKAIN